MLSNSEILADAMAVCTLIELATHAPDDQLDPIAMSLSAGVARRMLEDVAEREGRNKK